MSGFLNSNSLLWLPQSFPIKILTMDKCLSCHFLHTRPLQKLQHRSESSKLCDFLLEKNKLKGLETIGISTRTSRCIQITTFWDDIVWFTNTSCLDSQNILGAHVSPKPVLPLSQTKRCHIPTDCDVNRLYYSSKKHQLTFYSFYYQVSTMNVVGKAANRRTHKNCW